MKTVLHLTPGGMQLWCKGAPGWQRLDGPARGPVWVLTDLAEEAFSELTVPRIFGRDRQAFVARQLANRYPDTAYRTMLPTKPTGSLMDRLAPPRQTLLGVDAAARVDAALGTLPAPLVGVWATSMLLALIGSDKTLPADLFVVLPGQDALRIMVMKHRQPVLSRLVAGVSRPGEQVAEVVRTLRHLENTRVLERGVQRRGVLFLGDSAGIEALLAAEQLDLLPWPGVFAKAPPVEWRDALFDLVVKSPAGQLAPLSSRTAYVASQVRRVAYGAAALCALASLWGSAVNLRSMWASQVSAREAQTQAQSLLAQSSQFESRTAGFGVSADLVRRAVALDLQEVTSAPSLHDHLQQLAQAVGQFDGVRLSQLTWRMLPVGSPACPTGPAGLGAVSEPATAETGTAPAARQVELSLDITLPETLREKAHADMVAALSGELGKQAGVRLLRDPAKGLTQAALSGGGANFDASKSLAWCLTLPGVIPRSVAQPAAGLVPSSPIRPNASSVRQP